MAPSTVVSFSVSPRVVDTTDDNGVVVTGSLETGSDVMSTAVTASEVLCCVVVGGGVSVDGGWTSGATDVSCAAPEVDDVSGTKVDGSVVTTTGCDEETPTVVGWNVSASVGAKDVLVTGAAELLC